MAGVTGDGADRRPSTTLACVQLELHSHQGSGSDPNELDFPFARSAVARTELDPSITRARGAANELDPTETGRWGATGGV